MANIVKSVQIQDGPSDVVYRYYFESDGASGELSNYTILNPDDLKGANGTQPYVPAGPPAGRCFNIQQIWYNLSGFDIVLSFASANPNKVWLLTPSVDSYYDFRPMSGLPDNTPDSDIPQGDIQISTNGFASAGCVGSLVLKVRKMK